MEIKQEAQEEQQKIEMMRHSLSHVLAAAVKKHIPEAKLGIGPAIENGFYYDFDVPEPITNEQLKPLEKEMRKLIGRNLPFVRKEMPLDEARLLFDEAGEYLKVELIDDLAAEGEETVTVYETGDFVDLCRGPHVNSTGELPVKGFKLDRVAGAYWRGDEHNQMLSRVYGLAFQSREDLDAFLQQRAEAEKRDHRRLGRELDLFVVSETVGKGLPILTPKGAAIRRVLERFIVDEELKRDYLHVYSSVLGRKELYEISGHWKHYQESMYPPINVDGEDYVLRPMTCPHHFMLYKSRPHSYRDLPQRYAEIASMYRKERSGELYGLIRLMGFHLADAHIICRPDQLKEEFRQAIELIQYAMECLGLEGCWYRASLHEEGAGNYVDNPEGWEQSERQLLEICEEMDIDYLVSRGDAAFYGPKLDVQMRNVHGKDETLFTNQIDMAMADRFDLTYIDSDGEKKRPWILHRSSIGCLERTIAFLTEYHAGAFPLWLAPIQARLLLISEELVEYGRRIYQEMKFSGLRVELDDRNESLGKKIREGRLQRIPYLCIIGGKEAEHETVTVRNRDTGEQETMPVENFVKRVKGEDEARATTLGIAGT